MSGHQGERDQGGRALGPTELLLHTADKVCRFNFVMIAGLSGPLTDRALEAALARVQEQHPLLNVRIVEDSGPPSFQTGDVPPIPLRVLSAEERDVAKIAADEANEPFDVEVGPLARCVLIRHENERSSLLVAFHHTIGDGTSGAYLLRDLFVALEQQKVRPQEHRETSYPLPDELEAHLPGANGLAGLLRHFGFVFRLIWKMLLVGIPRHFLPRAPLETRKVQLTKRSLKPEQMKRLLAAARSEDTTVHCALTAAHLLALQREREGSPLRVSVGTPVNLRSRLVPPVDEEIGLFVTVLSTIHRVDARSSLWRLATELRRELKAAVQRGDAFVGMPVQNKLLAPIIRRSSPLQVTRLVESIYPPGTGISNLGRLEIEPRYGDISVSSVGFGASLSLFGGLGSYAATHQDELTWYFGGMRPMVTMQELESIADRAIELIEEAISR